MQLSCFDKEGVSIAARMQAVLCQLDEGIEVLPVLFSCYRNADFRVVPSSGQQIFSWWPTFRIPGM